MRLPSSRDLRFLPLLIGVAAVALVVKAELVLSRLPALLADTAVIADAEAAGTAPAAGDPSPAEAGGASPSLPPPPSPSPLAPPSAQGGEPAADAGAADKTGALSEAEIKVLQQLAARRTALDSREAELTERSALLEAAESRIEGKVQELRELRATLEQLIATYEKQEDAKISSLVKIYENMKPKDAAKIFEALDMDTLLLVAERMSERKLAPIMATMEPGKAMEMTVELARLRRLPDPAAAAPAG